MISKVFALLACIVVTVTAQLDFNPGIVASVNTDLIHKHRLKITNFILEKLNTVKIPDIPFGSTEENGISGYINNNTYELAYLHDENLITVDYHVADNALTFTILDVMAKFRSNDVHVQDGIIKTNGQLEADLYRVEFVVGIQLSDIMATDGINKLPYINPYGVTVMIDRKHVDIQVFGSILSNFADVLAKLFRGKICDGIEVEVAHILTKQIPNSEQKNFEKIRRAHPYSF